MVKRVGRTWPGPNLVGGLALRLSVRSRFSVLSRGLGAGLVVLWAGGSPAAAEVGALTGPYAGLSFGYAGAGDDRVGLNPPGLVVGTLDNSGPVGGVLLGLGGEGRGLSYGIEIEAQLADVADRVGAGGVTARTRMTATAGLRARLGLAWDAGTVYVTGGPSWGRFDYSVTGGGFGLDRSFTRTGYSLGLGWQRPVSDRLSLRAEYLYSNFGTATLSDPVSGAVTRATPVNHRLGLALIARF